MSLTAADNVSTFIEAEELGTLIVVVIKAKNLHNSRAVSKQNPFCTVRVAATSQKTKTVTRGGQSPTWDHEARFKLAKSDDYQVLKLAVFDQNGSSADIIGDAAIPLHPAFHASVRDGYDAWHPLTYNKRYVGEVYLEMTFYPKTRRRSVARESRSAHTKRHVPSHSVSSSISMSSLRRELPSVPNSAKTSPDSSFSAGRSIMASHTSRSSHGSRSSRRKSDLPDLARQSRPLPKIPTGNSHPPGFYRTEFNSVPNLHSYLEEDTPSPARSRPLPSLGAVRSVVEDRSSELRPRQSASPPVPKHRSPRGSSTGYSNCADVIGQEDISRQINDWYGASMFKGLSSR